MGALGTGKMSVQPVQMPVKPITRELSVREDSTTCTVLLATVFALASSLSRCLGSLQTKEGTQTLQLAYSIINYKRESATEKVPKRSKLVLISWRNFLLSLQKNACNFADHWTTLLLTPFPAPTSGFFGCNVAATVTGPSSFFLAAPLADWVRAKQSDMFRQYFLSNIFACCLSENCETQQNHPQRLHQV